MLDLEHRIDDGKEPAVKTIDRAARVLRVLATGGNDGLALRDVATDCQMSKATAHRLLAALTDAGLRSRTRKRGAIGSAPASRYSRTRRTSRISACWRSP
jgi:DNA-binding IclR family transcriptional regulator